LVILGVYPPKLNFNATIFQLNKKYLQNNDYARVRIRPIAKRYHADPAISTNIVHGTPLNLLLVDELDPIDDVWMVRIHQNNKFSISNMRTMHVKEFEYDHCHNYASDPDAPEDGLKHGFLMLHSQLHLILDHVLVEPLTREERIY
jgi:hypothetical protein